MASLFLSRKFTRSLLLGIVLLMSLSFGSGYAYSALSRAQQNAIRIAYANGYKDALEFAGIAGQARVNQMNQHMDEMKTHVLSAADDYVKKVEAMNQ
ncbi:MAG: hypothetical protein Q9M26_05565 [Mariprofundales bacterium]|nr:hypothetical protein [Mariprofundales bacterium]